MAWQAGGSVNMAVTPELARSLDFTSTSLAGINALESHTYPPVRRRPIAPQKAGVGALLLGCGTHLIKPRFPPGTAFRCALLPPRGASLPEGHLCSLDSCPSRSFGVLVLRTQGSCHCPTCGHERRAQLCGHSLRNLGVCSSPAPTIDDDVPTVRRVLDHRSTYLVLWKHPHGPFARRRPPLSLAPLRPYRPACR